MKVRGFQVAPAELEGHLLMHPAVADACVVSIPDEYSGEIPLAYIVINAKLLELIKRDRREGGRLKAALIKVCYSCFRAQLVLMVQLTACCGCESAI
jgi:4-coumarate--CoA ligase